MCYDVLAMDGIFDGPSQTLHLEMARRLMILVALRASDGALSELRGEFGLPGNGLGTVMQALPLTRFASVDDVERIANDLELAAGHGQTGTHDEMYGVCYELALNAVQHSQSVAGCYVILERGRDTDGGVSHVLGVADCGMGIPASLRQNPDLAHVQNDDDAIALAMELHITGTNEAHRGLGLYHVMNVVKDWGGDCSVISGRGYLNVKHGIEVIKGSLKPTDRIAGTVAVVTLSVPAMR